MRRLPRLLLIIALLAAPASASAAERMVGPNDAVLAISEPDAQGVRYVGGDFTAWDAWDTGVFGAVDAASGAVDARLPRVGTTGGNPASVRAIIPDGSGGWYIGGQFDCVGGDGGRDGDCTDAGEAVRRNLARIDATGAVTAWDPSPVATGVSPVEINALAVSGGQLFVGGYFQEIGDGGLRVSRGGLVAYYADSGILNLAWNARMSLTSTVFALAATPAGLYVAGQFTSIGGQNRLDLAFLDPGGDATAWDPRPNQSARSLALDDEFVYVGGGFNALGGINALGVARFRLSDNTADASWTPDPESGVDAIEVVGDVVYLGGSFSCLGYAGGGCGDDPGEVPRRNVAAVDRTTGLPTAWDPSPDDAVVAIDAADGVVRLGGVFSDIGTPSGDRVAREGLALVSPAGAILDAPVVGGPVFALASDGGRVALGGRFASLGGERRQRLAAIDAEGALTSWAPFVDDRVEAIDVESGMVYVGGWFRRVSGVWRLGGAALAATGALDDWDPQILGAVYALVATPSTVYAGGDFLGLVGGSRQHVAAWNRTTGALLPWAPEPRDEVAAIAIVGDRLVVGGEFDEIASTTRIGLAAFDLATGDLLPWEPGLDPNLSPYVSDVAGADHTLVVGGRGLASGGSVFGGVGAFDLAAAHTASASGLLDWDPWLTGDVHVVATRGAEAFVGGALTAADGAPRGGAAAFSLGASCLTAYTASCLSSWNPQADGDVLAIAPTDGAVLLGGDFRRVNGRVASNLVRYGAPTPPRTPAAAPRSRSAVITWDAPADDGTSTVTGYVATASPSGASCTATGDARTCTIEGLANGERQTIAIRATNALGTSLASTSVEATPRRALRVAAITQQGSRIRVRIRTEEAATIRLRGTRPTPTTRATAPVCSARRTTTKAGTYTLTCVLNRASRKRLATRGFRVDLVVTLRAGDETATSTRSIRLRAIRPEPVTG